MKKCIKLSAIIALPLLFSQAFGEGSAVTYPQVATGQTKTFDNNGTEVENLKEGDALYGQDAHYSKGSPMAYRDNGDGTVTDLNTGLMWQVEPPKQGYGWQDAEKYCENLELGGHSDWRMPTAKELFSISDFSVGWPYVNTTYFKLVNNERIGKDEQYWTSNKYLGFIEKGGHNGAFGVNHGTGHIKTYSAGGQGGQGGQKSGAPQGAQGAPKGQAGQAGKGPQGDKVTGPQQGSRPQAQGGQQGGNTRGQAINPKALIASFDKDGDGQLNEAEFTAAIEAQKQGGQQGGPQQGGGQVAGGPGAKKVRAVRGTVYGINKFVDNGDGTITDQATGLMWAKVDSEKGMDWESALAYAENSELAGHSDWRLPNVKELQAILNYDRAPNSSDPSKEGPAIDPIFSCSDFINEKGDKDYPYFWTGTSALFRKGSPHQYAWYVAFGRATSPTGEDSHGAGGVRFDTKHKDGPAGEDAGRIYNYVRIVRDVK